MGCDLPVVECWSYIETHPTSLHLLYFESVVPQFHPHFWFGMPPFPISYSLGFLNPVYFFEA